MIDWLSIADVEIRLQEVFSFQIVRNTCGQRSLAAGINRAKRREARESAPLYVLYCNMINRARFFREVRAKNALQEP
jgi:hypothetical protein